MSSSSPYSFHFCPRPRARLQRPLSSYGAPQWSVCDCPGPSFPGEGLSESPVTAGFSCQFPYDTHDTLHVLINMVFQAKGFADESERMDGEVFRDQSNNNTCHLLNLLFVPTPSGVINLHYLI